MRKLFFGSTILILLFSTITANAASSAVTPLNQLSAINRLSQSIGMGVDQIQAQLDAGKILKQIAMESGMPANMFQKRIINKNFSPSVSKIIKHKKIIKKQIKKVHLTVKVK